jgi:hypothetical protein
MPCAMVGSGLVLIIVAATVPGIIIDVVDKGLIEALVIDDPESSAHEGFTSNRKSPTIMEVGIAHICCCVASSSSPLSACSSHGSQ